ncbi:MAG: ferritin-like domain-containing protein [Thiogranum sp.]|nr:ferritin-like domain-containing protein [Thiogranum sp.]
MQCLACNDPLAKCDLTHRTAAALRAGDLCLDSLHPPETVDIPGRPQRPRLVAPRELPRRRPGTREGRISLLHALAHIEFNAINLAWDAVYRFRGLPEEFYRDWSRVADEEARHFRLLCERLNDFDATYGDLDAHDGLWEMACKTAHDALVRMALVPRVLEARGLDVTPGIMERVREAGDLKTVHVLEIILRDEIGHVQIGTRWFRYLCAQRGLEAEATFGELLRQYMKGRVKRPFHYQAREQAGFNAREMDYLERLASAGK